MKLGRQFDPRRNALNAWRLTLATGVILLHSFSLTGRHLSSAPIHQFLRDAWVDGFFAISGFLITSSWLSNPRLRSYFAARGLRILPGLWVCLIITAFVVAPLGVAIQGGSAARLLLSHAPIEYVLKNSAVLTLQNDVGGTPRGIPFPLIWNGSLWTLIWEMLCYIAVAVLGIVGLLNRRWFIPAAFALAVTWSALLPTWVWSLLEEPVGTPRQIEAAHNPDTAALLMEVIAARFAVMFLAGALLYQLRNLIPARWSLVALSAAIALASMLLPNYRLVGAIPLAYAIIVSGALIRNKRVRLRTDLSYGVYIYAFPIQQLLVICGLGTMPPILFAIVATCATLPVAAISWFLVEKPAMSLKSRLKRRSTAPAGDPETGRAVPREGAENSA
ncbi:acyltransferase [Mycobacterium sp. 94-17]|uniref:acyltransferase family protein n=1 Tax=Mycobacterium sp. 94-17 TaxID=2986147 RepID=UPI002D1E7D58|nr:acyltransferase [Mycobacterium sp. 94-17]MEB4212032.1 acyltransferase [Mycobacterium sp. 94-17]